MPFSAVSSPTRTPEFFPVHLRPDKRLLIISHTPHYHHEGRWLGWGPTVREIDHLARLFSSVTHLAPAFPGRPPESALPYESPRIRLHAVSPAGGNRLRDKLNILVRYPSYVRQMRKELRKADAVHVRAPANISLLAMLLLSVIKHPKIRWFKYAGNWKPRHPDAWSYAVQRHWLSTRLHQGSVTVNGSWPDQPSHVTSFLNPCLTNEELGLAKAQAECKRLPTNPRLIFVGRIETEKGAGRALDVLRQLHQGGHTATIDFVGDGPQKQSMEAEAENLGLARFTFFHGWKARTALGPLYAQSHFMIMPCNSSEGWPKVLSEAMAHGVVPLAGNVSSIPQLLASFRCGKALDPLNITAFTDAVLGYLMQTEDWKRESEAAVLAAERFTYDRYLNSVRQLLNL